MIQIVNRKTWRGASVYVGRPTALGNPFIIGQDGDRATVLQKYRRWLWREVQRAAGPVFEEVQRLAQRATTDDLILSCWCAPLPCHAKILRDGIHYLNNQCAHRTSSQTLLSSLSL
ncbi:MAG TPA: DUF4326 domain-containing protein [Blastocatellia bacterium]|nr:DUF4326 domain-containing protein [Blastocatellia bacterium]HMY73949.1 DUF4326 domain-containing protein [Blastocatellia bacterium]HMZ17543.1 DUF4326 domain-containing protein [Blastocatellia bacterium]